MAGKKISDIEALEVLAKDLFKKLKLDVSINISEDEENDLLKVDIESDEEKGLIIGKKGETINSLQSMLGMMLKQKTGEWRRIQLNIGQWRERQEDYLKALAHKTADRALETGEPQRLHNLTPTQRRTVHLEIQGIDGVSSESQGEDDERYLIVKPV